MHHETKKERWTSPPRSLEVSWCRRGTRTLTDFPTTPLKMPLPDQAGKLRFWERPYPLGEASGYRIGAEIRSRLVPIRLSLPYPRPRAERAHGWASASRRVLPGAPDFSPTCCEALRAPSPGQLIRSWNRFSRPICGTVDRKLTVRTQRDPENRSKDLFRG